MTRAPARDQIAAKSDDGAPGRTTTVEDPMLRLTSSVCIDAPVATVWAALSDLASIHLWVEAITHSYCPAQSRGVGAVRICELKQARLEETIVAWDEGRSFTYRGVGAPMLKRAANTWSVAPHGEQTLVTSTAEAELKGGVVGLLVQPLMKIAFARMGARSLASLKYYVEQGRPYPGRARDLALGPVAC
jgi:carbon monoxide dehydrogenase subunit G